MQGRGPSPFHHLLWTAGGMLAIEAEQRTWVVPTTRALWLPPGTLTPSRVAGDRGTEWPLRPSSRPWIGHGEVPGSSRFWFIVDPSGTPVAAIDTSDGLGWGWNGRIPLLAAYHDESGDLDRVLAHLIPPGAPVNLLEVPGDSPPSAIAEIPARRRHTPQYWVPRRDERSEGRHHLDAR